METDIWLSPPDGRDGIAACRHTEASQFRLQWEDNTSAARTPRWAAAARGKSSRKKGQTCQSTLLSPHLSTEAVGSWFLEACWLFFCTACSTLSDTTVPLPGWQQDVVSSARESTWKGVNEGAGAPSNTVLLKSLSAPVFLPHEDSAVAPHTLFDVLLADSSY